MVSVVVLTTLSMLTTSGGCLSHGNSSGHGYTRHVSYGSLAGFKTLMGGAYKRLCAVWLDFHALHYGYAVCIWHNLRLSTNISCHLYGRYSSNDIESMSSLLIASQVLCIILLPGAVYSFHSIIPSTETAQTTWRNPKSYHGLGSKEYCIRIDRFGQHHNSGIFTRMSHRFRARCGSCTTSRHIEHFFTQVTLVYHGRS